MLVSISEVQAERLMELEAKGAGVFGWSWNFEGIDCPLVLFESGEVGRLVEDGRLFMHDPIATYTWKHTQR